MMVIINSSVSVSQEANLPGLDWDKRTSRKGTARGQEEKGTCKTPLSPLNPSPVSFVVLAYSMLSFALGPSRTVMRLSKEER